MQQSSLGRIFIYDDNKPMLSAFKDIFTSHAFQMFGTDNVYQLLQYAKEITPDVMIFDIEENYTAATSTINHMGREINPEKYPIIVLKPQSYKFKVFPQIAHYLHTPLNMPKFIDILESYCVGNKQHDIMLLGSYNEKPGKFRQQLDSLNYSYFEVHNEDAARLYLAKNTPKIVCIEYSLPYITARHHLNHKHIFYVDRDQYITEIQNFLH